ncbi:glutaredoxin family protein [Undibacterium arcticum]|uniref:Glutaredoxin family protein n=1 Tax=Undibacterium arcticum TaxID=1762892 RepID=A0ABV7FAA7_9BURK
MHFILYSRSYCHLCEDMLQALQPLQSDYAFTLDVVDVDADDTLLAQYDELVPVLVAQRGAAAQPVFHEQLCHYFLDEARVRAYLVGQPAA